MANDYFNASGYPATRSPGVSASLRNELASVALAFDKFPGLTGNAGKVLAVNPSGTALTYATAINGITVGLSSAAAGAFTTLTSSGAATLASLGVTGAATVGTTLGVTGAATVGGTLGVTGAATLSTLSTSGLATLASLSVTGTSAHTGNATFTTLSSSGTASLNAVVTVAGITVGGGLSVTGTLAANGNATVAGTLGVTGALTGTTGTFSLGLTGKLAHAVSGGYMFIGSYDSAAYGNGSGKVWWNQNLYTLQVGSDAGLTGTTVESGYFKAGVQLLGTTSDLSTQPSFTWSGDANTGIWHPAASTIGFTVAGSSTWHVLSSGAWASHATPPSFGSIGKVSLAGTTATFSSSLVVSRTSADLSGPYIRLGKSYGTVVGQYTAPPTSAELGAIAWYTADGTDGDGITARIRCVSNEAHSSTRHGAQMEFGTYGAGGVGFLARLVIDEAGLRITDTATTPTAANGNCDSLVIDGTGHTGMTFLGGITSTQQIRFGDTDSSTAAGIAYAHNGDTMSFYAGGAGATIFSVDVGGVTMSTGKELVLNAAVTPTSVYSAGFVGIPTLANTATATKTAVGKVYLNTASITINNSVFAAGDVIAVYNNSAASINITQGTITTMRLGGTTTVGTRALAPRGWASIFFPTATECVVTGTGVS